MNVLGVVEHDRGALNPISLQMLTAARALGPVDAVLIGEEAAGLVPDLAPYGVAKVHLITHDILTDYAPEAWGEAVARLIAAERPDAVLAAGTDRGNEVMAHAAARADLPMVANCLEVTPGDPWTLTRVRWGGSLVEQASLSAETALLTIAPHSAEASPAAAPGAAESVPFSPDLDPTLARTRVVERGEAAQGVTLTTAPVVVGGGRGVGSPEGFALLEELAGMLGGAVGCSRVATNNGWRPHSDQVGQTGTRIAPELYIACGISGAIQHWVGCAASKKILAINSDPEAPMVIKADYAAIGDLHEVLGAVIAELRGVEA
jgi:electron transfer flavoprotein alpha subunit